jgi:small subunit ribosomal protein S21
VFSLAKIYVDENESIDQAIKRFRKRCERDGIKRELKKRAFYEKPSMMRKRKKEQAKRKELKRIRKYKQRMNRKR